MDEFEQMLAEMAQQRREQQQAQHLLGGGLGSGPAQPADLQVQAVSPAQDAGVMSPMGFERKSVPGAVPPSYESRRLVGVTPEAPRFATTSNWSSTSTRLDPARELALDRASGLLQTQIELRGEQAQGQAAKAETEIKDQREELRSHTDSYARVRSDYVKRKVDPMESKLLTMVEEQAAKEKEGVDSEKWWGTRDGAQKVFSVIAVALGGLAQGISGGRVPNTAAQMISKAIDRNIAEQKTNLLAGRAAIAGQQGLLGAVYRRLGNMDQSEAVTRVGLITLGQSYLKELDASGQKTMAALNAGVTSAQLNVNKAQALLQLTAKRVTGGGSRTPVDPVAAEMKQAQLRILQARATAAEGGTKGKGKILGEVMGQLTPQMDQIETLATQQAKTGVGEYFLGKAAGWLGIGTGANATEAGRNAMTMGYVKAYQGARASDRDLQMFRDLVPKTVSTIDGYRRSLETMEAMAVKNFSRDLGKAIGEGQLTQVEAAKLLARKRVMAKAVTNQILSIYIEGNR